MASKVDKTQSEESRKALGGYWEKALVPSLATSYDEVQHQPEEEKELGAFNRIAQDLGKYMRPSSQDEYQDYINQVPYNIGKCQHLCGGVKSHKEDAGQGSL